MQVEAFRAAHCSDDMAMQQRLEALETLEHTEWEEREEENKRIAAKMVAAE